MFKIYSQNTLDCFIEGCPENGLPAIDFRRQHGLPDAPTNRIHIKLDHPSEAVCRRFQEFLNYEGDLRIGEASGHEVGRQYTTVGIPYPRILPPAILSGVLHNPISDEQVSAFIAALLDIMKRHLTQKEEESKANELRAAIRKAEEAARAEEQQRKQDAMIRERTERLRPHFTTDEAWLEGRGKLNPSTVEKRLCDEAIQKFADDLDGCPVPDPYTEGPGVCEDHAKRYQKSYWKPEWVGTVRFIESVSGHPVESICEDCIQFNTHLTVPWLAEPLKVHVAFEKPKSRDEDED